MLVFYIALLVLALWGSKFSGRRFFREESFSKEVTDSIKGIFIWLVFLSHFASYVTYTSALDLAGGKINSIFGQLMVACFLLYSGYGVCESIQRKGADYVRSMPQNRILKTLVKFDIAVLIYLAIALSKGDPLTVKQVLLSFIGWESVGNSNWYIFVVLMLYLVSWISFLLTKSNLIKGAIVTTVLTGGLIVFLYATRESYWYDTALCYVLGIWVSVYKDKILTGLTKNNTLWSVCALGSLCAFCILYLWPKNSLLEKTLIFLIAPCFCVVVMVALTKIRVSNRFLAFSGKYLFELYILQRIPMILLKLWRIDAINLYVYCVLCIVITIALAVGFRFVTNKTERLFYTN